MPPMSLCVARAPQVRAPARAACAECRCRWTHGRTVRGPGAPWARPRTAVGPRCACPCGDTGRPWRLRSAGAPPGAGVVRARRRARARRRSAAGRSRDVTKYELNLPTITAQALPY